MLIKFLLVISCALLSSACFTFLLRKIALKYNILVHQKIPLIGGIVIGLSFILSVITAFLIFRCFPQKIAGMIAASFLMLLFGIVDDFRELSILAKFLAQIIAGSILIFFGVRTQIVYIGNIFNLVVTFIWILGISNAFNHLDVIDGLAGGTAFIASIAFLGVSILNNDLNASILTISLASALFIFLFYNFPPAKIYMGNTGSHFLGFILAAIALEISFAPLERKIALLSPLLILGLPILDTTFLVFARIFKKQLPFKKSNDHITLKILSLGYSKKKALFAMLALCLFFSICGLLVSHLPVSYCIIIIILAASVSLLLLRKMKALRVNG